MRIHHHVIPATLRRAVLTALIVCPLLGTVGCVTTQSQVRTKPSCSKCGCANCTAALKRSAAAEQKTADRTAAGEMSMDQANDLALPSPLSPPPAPPEFESDEMPPRQVVSKHPLRDVEARRECAQLQQETNELRSRLQELEQRLAGEHVQQETLRHSLAAVNSKVGSLSSELHYWQQEVKRIDAEAEAQHREDLQSLQTISELISRLPRPTTAPQNASWH